MTDIGNPIDGVADKLRLKVRQLYAFLKEANQIQFQPIRRLNEQQYSIRISDLASGILNAIMDALSAHSAMSKQALDSERVRDGLKDVLLGPAELYESLRSRGQADSSVQAR